MKKKDLNNILNDTLIYIIMLILNFSFIVKILDSDLFFDLRSAKDILTYGLDFKDHMSMFDGLKYLYHHWLYDLIIYPIFNLGGYPLLFIFILLIFFIFSICIYKYINSRINNKLISLISTSIIIALTGRSFFPRVQSMNYLLVLLQFMTINKLYTTGEKKYSIISIILSIILVNIHFPLWILVPVFYLPYIVQLIIKVIKDKYKIKLLDKKIEIEECKNTKLAIITFIIILLSCLISPYGLLPYTFGFKVTSLYNDVYSNIGEMSRVNIIHYPIIIGLYILFIITLIIKKKIKLSDIFYLLGLGIFGIIAARNIVYLYTYYIIIITCILFKDIKIKKIDIFKRLNVNKEVIKGTLIIAGIFVFAMCMNAMNFKEYQYGIDGGGEPINMANYITEHLDYKNLKFYNEFNTGSYFAYRDIPTFVDSRVEVFIKEFNGKQDIIHDYYHMSPKDIIDKYQFDYIITNKGTDMYDYMVENNYEQVFSEYKFYYIFKNAKS